MTPNNYVVVGYEEISKKPETVEEILPLLAKVCQRMYDKGNTDFYWLEIKKDIEKVVAGLRKEKK